MLKKRYTILPLSFNFGHFSFISRERLLSYSTLMLLVMEETRRLNCGRRKRRKRKFDVRARKLKKLLDKKYKKRAVAGGCSGQPKYNSVL